jgi:hypothetical protein
MSMLNCNVAPRRFVSHALHFSDPQPRRCKQPMEVTAEKLWRNLGKHYTWATFNYLDCR